MLPLYVLVYLWFGCPFFFFFIKSLIFVFRFAVTCLFAFFCEVVHFLFRSFSPNPFPPSNTTISLSLFFFFSLGSMAHYLSTFPLIFFLFFLFVLFYRHFSCSQLWALIWFSFDLVWDFWPVSRSLSFVFPLFFFFSCWLSSTYDLIWIFVAFLTATGVVSLKSYFAIQYQNCNFIIRYLTYSTCTLLHCCFFYSNLFISIYSF